MTFFGIHFDWLGGLTDLSFWGLLAVTLAMTHLTIVAVTLYLHRCQAHRSLLLHPAVSHVFRFWLWMTTGMVTREWSAIHRKHHAKVESDDDPHSPQRQGIAKILFAGAVCYNREKKNRETIERYGYGAPTDWIEMNVYTRHPQTGFVSMLIIDVILFGLPGALVWLTQMIWIPFWAAGVINGIGHYWGYRNFQPQDESRNIVPIAAIIGGEELHNNHHAFPTSAKFSNRWYEFDLGWLYIQILSKLGLAKVKNRAPKLLSPDSRAACDLDTLQSIIANRLEVAARFSSMTKKTCHDELSQLREKIGEQVDRVESLPTTRALNDWLHGMESRLSAVDKTAVQNLITESAVVRQVSQMRQELTALWEDKSLTAEQMLTNLREWCVNAEKSNIVPLVNFAKDLRGYRVSQLSKS